MGGNLCGQEYHQRDPFIFDYRYGEDDKEIKIKHNDSLITNYQPIRPSLEDCQNKLRYSEKRFKDVNFSSQPIKLICEGKQIHCHFERPEAFLKRDDDLRNKIYKIVNLENCKSSNIIVGDEVMQYLGVFQCYLADNPELIDRIILTKSNSYGIHAIHVVYQGKRQVLFIDDYILCNNQGPFFSRPIKYTDMWTCIIEKAWLKLNSFLRTGVQKVNPYEVFKSFLMFPMKSFVMTESIEQNEKIIRQNLLQPASRGNNIGCVITTKMAPPFKIGISGRRFYYLKKILFIEGKPYFYMRNPCGQFDFRGNLCDIPRNIEEYIYNSTRQHPAPGDFILTEAEFQQQTESFFTVSYSPHSPIISDQEVNFYASETQEVFLKFQLRKSSLVSLRLIQMSKIGYDPLTYILVDADRKTIVSGERNEDGCFGVEQTSLLNGNYQTLMPSNYILRLKKKPENKGGNNLEWLAGATLKNKDLVIATSQEDIKFSVSKEYQNEFQAVLRSYAKKQLSLNPKPQREEIDHIVIWLGDIVLVYVSKINSGKESMSMQVNFPQLKNLSCISHKIGSNYSPIPPFKQDVLLIFQKKVLTEATSVGSYSLNPY